jgi:hypothetical protein
VYVKAENLKVNFKKSSIFFLKKSYGLLSREEKRRKDPNGRDLRKTKQEN